MWAAEPAKQGLVASLAELIQPASRAYTDELSMSDLSSYLHGPRPVLLVLARCAYFLPTAIGMFRKPMDVGYLFGVQLLCGERERSRAARQCGGVRDDSRL